jgi:hypothetical protein
MKSILFVFFAVFSFLLGAIAHERDMYNNLRRCGNAYAWTCKIYSIEMKNK